jgi:hypothetical protein
MNAKYVRENAAQRDRLFKMTADLTDADLEREVGPDWSVASKLVHLAFWDRYALSLISRWEREGPKSLPSEVDAVNDAVRALCSVIPPAASIDLARNAADAIDRKLEGIDGTLVTAVESVGRVRLLRRSEHRREHLDQIEKVLKG